ncbi:MAG TPA: PAS domain S-box protein [Bacteroidota bacterium]|nr:PAS domain S-box protein [Bacteroidota bacterium]
MFSLFIPREFPDPVATLTARHFHWLVIAMMAIATPALVIVELFLPERFPRDILYALILDADGMILLFLARRGRVKAGSILFVSTMFIIVTSAVWTAGGITAPGVPVYYIISILAAFLLGMPAAIATTLAIILTGILLIWAGSDGVIAAGPLPISPATLWVLHCMVLSMLLAVYYISTGTLKSALDQAASQLRERMQIQDDLVKNEQMLSSVVNCIPQSVFWKDAEGRYMGCNTVFARAVGLTHPDQVRGKTDYDLPWRPNDAESYRADDAEVIRSGRTKRHIIEPLRQADGTSLLVETHKVPLVDAAGHAYGVLGIYDDITEQHRMEEAVRKSEEKFSRVFYSSPIPMGITVMADGEIIDINESFQSTFGFTREDVQGKKPHEVGLWPVPQQREAIIAQLREHGAVRNRQTRYSTKSGRMGDALLSAEVIEIDGKKCVVFMAVDITDLKDAEEEVRSSRNQLRRLAAHIEKVREEERAHVAREIHDQLGQEMTGLKMDLAWCNSRIPADQKALAERTRSMIGLVDQTVQTIRKIASELRPGILDDLGLIPALEWQAQEFQSRSGIPCTLSPGAGDRPLDIGRTTALFRIFQETLTNVARHAHATRVDAVLRWGEDHVGLEVADNGVGMPDSATEPGESFGILGMKERAMMYGGELSISPTRGGGTTVTVNIPTADSAGRTP